MLVYNKHIFLFTFLLLFFNHIPSISSQCIETPLFGKAYSKDCPSVEESQKKPLNKLTNSLLDNDNPDSRKIKILFTCDEKKTPELCKKADIGFNNAALIVENTFDLKVPITVNASFEAICETFIKCLDGKPQPIGAAGPFRMLPLNDSDGETRLFPQALVKQLQLPKHPEFSPVDIVAGFNSKSDVFWFRGDPPIGKDQVDFEIVVVHEFLHGLGFATSWDDYFNDKASSLAPSPSFVFANPETIEGVKNGTITFTGFQEYVMDKLLVFTKDNSPLTLVAKKLNQFAPLGTEFADRKAFFDAFAKSPEYQLTKDLFKDSTTKGSITIKLPDGDNALLETSLVPFTPGSTFGHIDSGSFANTTDFLMRFKAPRQVIMDDLTSINGNDPKYTNPIGPKTIAILQSIGYDVKENPGTFKLSSNENSKQNSLTTPSPQDSTNPNSKLASEQQQQQQQQTNNAFTITTNTLSSLLLSFIISIVLF